MPEDSNPHLSKETVENYNYYTLPIDIHTPMWLWSRNGFKELE